MQKSMAEILRKPGGLVTESASTRVVPALKLAPMVRIGAKDLAHLEVATYIMKYYGIVNIKLLASLLRHDDVIKNFKLEFDAIKEYKNKEVSAPQISHKLDIVCWTELFLDFLLRIIGDKNIPLSYDVRPMDNVDYDSPFESMTDTYCTEHDGSLDEELIKITSHCHLLFK